MENGNHPTPIPLALLLLPLTIGTPPMAAPIIKFDLVNYIAGVSTQGVPRPMPAAQAIAARIKRLPSEIADAPDSSIPTVKKCPPFVDAMTSGYLIPAIADVEFVMHADRLEFKSSIPIVENHDIRQLAGTSFQQMAVVKFINPWIVSTPPGFSCLFMAPLNRFEIPFQPLAGVVETDQFYHEVNFPAVCILAPGQRFLLKKGTPLVQVIPFRREEWTSEFGDVDPATRLAWDQLGPREGRYKEHNWQRKKFE